MLASVLWSLFPEWCTLRAQLAYEAERLGVHVRWWWTCNRLLRAIGAIYMFEVMQLGADKTRVPLSTDLLHVQLAGQRGLH